MKNKYLLLTALSVTLAAGPADAGWWYKRKPPAETWVNTLTQWYSDTIGAETPWADCPNEHVRIQLVNASSRQKSLPTGRMWDTLPEIGDPSAVPANAANTRSSSESYHVNTWRDALYDKRTPWIADPVMVYVSVDRCDESWYYEGWAGQATPTLVDTDATGVTTVEATVTIESYQTGVTETHVYRFVMEPGSETVPSRDVYGNKNASYAWMQYSHGSWIYGGPAVITIDGAPELDASGFVGKTLQTVYEASK